MVRVRLAVVALVGVLGSVVALPGSQAPETGGLAGHVKLKPRVGGAALPSTAYPTRAVGPRETHAIPEIKNVVVYLKNAAFHGTLPPRKAELHQEHETFVPHVLAVTRGSTVDFPNDDPIYHNVFSLSSAASFNLGRYPKGESRHETLTKAGIVKVYCQIHSHMSATILVFDHPFFTIPELDGSFELPNLPAGDYTVVGWHERVGERVVAVHVEAGKTTTVDLSLPVEESR
ncbi:MAG: carboxypeptidase regulatory-like domain-containing protein [Vicinamibacterales bacterium]